MSIFKRKEPSGGLADFHQDTRVHSRFRVDAGVGTLTLGSGRKGIVKDVSYSGMAAAFPHPVDEPDLSVTQALGCRLDVLGMATQCRLRVVRGIKRGNETLYGFSFLHTTPEALLFLRELIEPMSRGASLAPLDTRTMATVVRDGGWEWYLGDGPTEVILKRDIPGGPATTAVITFRLNDLYLDVLYRDGTLKTHRSDQRTIDPVVPATLDRFGDGAADPRILRSTLCLLLALPAGLTEALKPVVATALATLPLVDQRAA